MIIAKKCAKLGFAAPYLRILHTRFLTESECAVLAVWCVLGITNPGRKDRRLLKTVTVGVSNFEQTPDAEFVAL